MNYIKQAWSFVSGYRTQAGFFAAGIVWAVEAIGIVPQGTLASMTPLFVAVIGAAGAAKFQKLVNK